MPSGWAQSVGALEAALKGRPPSRPLVAHEGARLLVLGVLTAEHAFQLLGNVAGHQPVASELAPLSAPRSPQKRRSPPRLLRKNVDVVFTRDGRSPGLSARPKGLGQNNLVKTTEM